MKVLRFFALLLVFIVFCTEQEKVPGTAQPEQQQQAQKEQKIIKHPVQDSAVLEAKIEELEQCKQELKQREQTLDKRKQELSALQDSLNTEKEKLAQREIEIKQLHRNSWWTLIIGILLILISLVLFIIRPRKSDKSQSQPEQEEQTESFAEKDPLYDQAVESVLREQNASVTRLQKELGIGRTRVNKVLDLMEQHGLVGPAQPNRARKVLLTWEDYKK